MAEQSTQGPKKIVITDQPKRSRITADKIKQYFSYAVVGSLSVFIVFLWIKRSFYPETIDTVPVERSEIQASASPAIEPEPKRPEPEARERPVMVEESWVPSLDITPLDGEENLSLEQILAKARDSMEEDRLISATDGAAQLITLALKLAPDDNTARELEKEIGLKILAQARKALEENRIVDAIDTIPYLELLHANKEDLAEIKKTIQLKRNLDQLLAQAQIDLESGRIAFPADDSALYYFKQALNADPENQTAQLGLNEVESRLSQEALAAARDMKFDYAFELLDVANSINEQSLPVADMRQRIETLRLDTRNQLLAEAREKMQDKDFNAALRKIEAAERIGLNDGSTLQSRALLANAKLYGMHYAYEVFNDKLKDEYPAPEMVVIPIGEFFMGSDRDEEGHRANEAPRHRVRFRRGFALSTREITVGEFRRFIEDTNYVTDAEKNGKSVVYDERTGRQPKRRGIHWRHGYNGELAADGDPVMHVSWNDAKKYTEWLASETGKNYRLPSEAEFEYAARAGSRGVYWWGDGSPAEPITNVAGEDDQSPRRRGWKAGFDDYSDGYWGPAPAGHYRPNPFGLFDMSGNLSEYVADCWHDTYSRAPVNGIAWINRGCEERVIKGGSWGSDPMRVRLAYRLATATDYTSNRVGFRVARDL